MIGTQNPVGKALLTHLRSQGLSVEFHPRGVAISPSSQLTPEIRHVVREYKPQIRAALVAELGESVFASVEVAAVLPHRLDWLDTPVIGSFTWWEQQTIANRYDSDALRRWAEQPTRTPRRSYSR
jgi:hypothetical protein